MAEEFNDLTAKNFTARLAQADFVTKTDFDDKLRSLNQKNISSNKTKHLLIENEINRIKKFLFSNKIFVWKKWHLKLFPIPTNE